MKVGDKVFIKHGYGFREYKWAVTTIQRETKTTWVVDYRGLRFKKDTLMEVA